MRSGSGMAIVVGFAFTATLIVSSCAKRCTDSTEPAAKIHTPWPDKDAEILALMLSGEVVAPRDLYEIIHADLAAIRSEWCDSFPQICEVSPRPFWIVGSLGLWVNELTYEAIQAGTYHAWNELNDYYGLESVDLHGIIQPLPHRVSVNFTPRLNPSFLLAEYAQLPGVLRAYEYHRGGDGPHLYGSVSADLRFYTFCHAWGDCPAGYIYRHCWYFRVEGDSVVYTGEQGDLEMTNFQLRRLPGFGFCPVAGAIFSANIRQDIQGLYLLSGTLAIEADDSSENCLEYVITGCLIETPFPSITLSRQQADFLNSLLAAIPDENILPNPACDPCLITEYMFNERHVEANPCAFEHSAQFWQSIEDLEDFLHQLVQGD